MTTTHSLQRFEFNKKQRTLCANLSDLGMKWNALPTEITVRSHHTGVAVTFVYDTEAAERNEFWDGEMCEYKPKGECSIRKLVLLCC
jgi:hypothetical protein